MKEKAKEEGKTHWCERVRISNDEGETFWATCNPHEEECDGGISKDRVGDTSHIWKSTNDDERTKLPWVDRLSFNDWVKIKYGKVDYLTKEKIWQEHTKEEMEKEKEDLTEEIEEGSSEIKDNLILEMIEDKLDESWYKGTESDDEIC